MSKLELGELQITALTDIERFDVPLSTIFPESNPDEIKNMTWIGPEMLSSGLLHLKIRSWLLRLNGKAILIDTCVGAHKDRPSWQDWHHRDGANWLSALAAEGLEPDDIDIVMCTHLHADHVGWNTKLLNGRWVPTFQNARYICSKDEYAYWSEAAELGDDKHGAFGDSVLPIMEADKMELVESDWDLGPGLHLEMTPGHSPGHMCLKAKHGPGAVFAGDIVHSPLQLAFPEISSAFCSDPVQARESRLKILNEVANGNSFLIPAHFPNPGWMQIDHHEDGFMPRFVA